MVLKAQNNAVGYFSVYWNLIQILERGSWLKQFIIMSAMTMLGIFIYNLIAGSGDGSMLSALSGFFKGEIAARAV